MRLPGWKRKKMIAEPAVADKEFKLGFEVENRRFCELFETYQPALRRLVAAYVANPADREDLLQEIAVGIWKSLPGFRGEASERTWIYRIAHNIAIRSSSRLRRWSTQEPLIEGSFDYQSADSSVESVLLVEERRNSLVKGIRELSMVDRQLVTLHLEGLTAAEIEEITGVSQGAIATRLTRIRQRLAKRLHEEGMRHEHTR
jgi:RNA polymerase sigma-70 factor, ECF subfamily